MVQGYQQHWRSMTRRRSRSNNSSSTTTTPRQGNEETTNINSSTAAGGGGMPPLPPPRSANFSIDGLLLSSSSGHEVLATTNSSHHNSHHNNNGSGSISSNEENDMDNNDSMEGLPIFDVEGNIARIRKREGEGFLTTNTRRNTSYRNHYNRWITMPDMECLGDCWQAGPTARRPWFRTLIVGSLGLLFFLAVSVYYFHNKTTKQEDSNSLFMSSLKERVVYTGTSTTAAESESSSTTTSKADAANNKKNREKLLHALQESSTLQHLKHGAVASDHPVCSAIGLQILQELQGNAVDAAVAVALCLGVANPASSGIGGGAFLLIHRADAANNRQEGDEADEPQNPHYAVMPAFLDARKTNTDVNGTVRDNGKITEVIDCRERAPAAAYTNMFVVENNKKETSAGEENETTRSSVLGGWAVGVPGELRGLELAHARHGRLPWKTVVEPAMHLALDGVTVNPNLAHEIVIGRKKALETRNIDYGLKALLTRSPNHSWKQIYRTGDLYKNEALGLVLRDVAEHGANALYTGPRAATLVADVLQSGGGVLTVADLERYKPVLRTPVFAHVAGMTVVGVPPPSSGGAAILGAARFLAGYGLPSATTADTLSIHRLIEACKHVFAIRMSLADPDYDDGADNMETVEEAVYDLIAGPYMDQLREMTLDNATLSLSQYGGKKWSQLADHEGTGAAQDAKEGDRRRRRRKLSSLDHNERDDDGETTFSTTIEDSKNQQGSTRRRLARPFGYLNDHGTSHFSIVDKDGNAVAMTTSVNTYFGSKVVSQGIVLNNQMDDFATPGKANYFGLKPAEANYIQPNKIPLSSMSPTMVFLSKQRQSQQQQASSPVSASSLGDLMLVLGASGGPKIITAVLQVFVNHLLQGKPLFESVLQPRIHEQLVYHGASVTATENDNSFAQAPALTIQLSNRTKQALTSRGHALLDIDYTGTVQAISIDLETKELTAVCDVRKGGAPAGY